MRKVIRVGSRESKLAVAQTMLVLKEIEKKHPEIAFELVTMKTTGDKILDRNLDQIGGKGLFVKELDQALLDGRVDAIFESLYPTFQIKASCFEQHSAARQKSGSRESKTIPGGPG